MPRNTLGDLNNHLFEQLERLNDQDLEGDQFKQEVERAKAMTDVSKSIVETGKLVLEGQRFADNSIDEDKTTPKMLEGDK